MLAWRWLPPRAKRRRLALPSPLVTWRAFNSYGMRAVQDALVTGGTLFICNDGGKKQLEQRIADVRTLRSDIEIKTFEPEL